MTGLISKVNLPFLFLHEIIHLLVARALGMEATRYTSYTVFCPKKGGDAAIIAVLLAPCTIGLTLLLLTAVLLFIVPQWWIISVHTGLLALWFVTSSLSDIHTVYTFFRYGKWLKVENLEYNETIGGWIKKRLRSRIQQGQGAP